MTATPWPPYVFFSPAVEYAIPQFIGVRDWFRLKILMSPSGGLDPDEARFWLTCGETRDDGWHSNFDVATRYIWWDWYELLQAGGPLPARLQAWTERALRDGRYVWWTGTSRLETRFREWSASERLVW